MKLERHSHYDSLIDFSPLYCSAHKIEISDTDVNWITKSQQAIFDKSDKLFVENVTKHAFVVIATQ